MVAVTGAETISTLAIPNEVRHEGQNYKVFSIEDNAFNKRDDIYSVVIPESVKIIGKSAFYMCNNINTVTIHDKSVENIRDNAFDNCKNLVTITLPNSLLSIGFEFFASCSSLTTINFPKSLTSIGRRSFMNTPLGVIRSYIENPEYVPLPTYNSILNDAFYYVFGGRNTYEDCTLFVPKGTIAKYKVANVWKEFNNIVEMENTSIDRISQETNAHNKACHNLRGMQISEKPTEKGIYIINL